MSLPIRLRPVNHGPKRNRYCGPSALSILTGIDTGRAAALLRRVSGAPRIRGTSSGAVKTALWNLGIHMSWTAMAGRRPTLTQWLKLTRTLRGDNTYLLAVGHHWAIIQGRRWACGIVGKPVPLKDSPKRRARVTEVYVLSRLSKVKLDTVVPPIKRPIDTERKPRAEAKALAALHGIEIEVGDPSPDCIYVSTGLLGPDQDPHEGDHYVYSWSEALTRVRDYVAALGRVNSLEVSRVDPSSRAILLDSSAQPATVVA